MYITAPPPPLTCVSSGSAAARRSHRQRGRPEGSRRRCVGPAGAQDAAWTWTELPVRSTARFRCSGCVMSDGRFAVLGGGGGTNDEPMSCVMSDGPLHRPQWADRCKRRAHVLYTVHYTPYTVHHTLFIIHLTSYIIKHHTPSDRTRSSLYRQILPLELILTLSSTHRRPYNLNPGP